MALRSEPDAVCACFVCMCAVARKIWAGLTGFVLVDVGVRVERCTDIRRAVIRRRGIPGVSREK